MHLSYKKLKKQTLCNIQLTSKARVKPTHAIRSTIFMNRMINKSVIISR